MSPLILLAMLSGLLVAVSDGSDEEDAVAPDPELPEDPEDPEQPEDPDLMDDTGASFVQTDEGVEIELGEDETGSLAVFYYEDTEDREDFVEIYEARFYLVPEGVDWSGVAYETRFDVPGAGANGEDPFLYELEDFEAFHGLELLGVVNLDDPLVDTSGPNQGVGEIVSNAPVEGYFLTANTDGDDLVSFLPEDFIVLRNGVPEVAVDEDTTGTEGTDWLSTSADGITIAGAGGDDILTTISANVTLDGGDGADTIEGLGNAAVIIGGAGDDRIGGTTSTVSGGIGNDSITITGGLAEGGEGDDDLTSYNVNPALLYGQLGDDRIVVSGPESRAFGGEGDDFVSVNNGAIGYGGVGNDHLQVESGSVGVGGAGDDLFTVWNQFRDPDDPATVTGGEGADTIDARVWNAGGGEADQIYLHMTDFDPEEDILQVGVFQTEGSRVEGIEIVESPDGSGTDVRVEYSPRFNGLPGIAVIRLEGTTGLSEDQIVIVD